MPGLTDALVTPLPEADPASWSAASADARHAWTGLAGGRAGTGRFRITGHDVRKAWGQRKEASSGTEGCERRDEAAERFAWSARTARRGLGLAGVRALVAGDARSPVEAVRGRVAESSRLVRGGSHCQPRVDGTRRQ